MFTCMEGDRCRLLPTHRNAEDQRPDSNSNKGLALGWDSIMNSMYWIESKKYKVQNLKLKQSKYHN